MITENDIEKLADDLRTLEEGTDCLCCGSKFIPINKEDQFCKKCLQKLFFELISKMEKNTQLLCNEVPWRFEEMKKLVCQYKDIAKPKTKQAGGAPR